MQSSNIPTKIPLPFANSAGSGYINTIPVASQIGITNGRASLHDGFPPDTFLPISSGGVPPFGGDFNGILNEITAIQQWQEAGGFFPYDSGFSTTISGYPKGAVLQSTSFNGFWTSTSENNTTNPDTGGAGWVPTAFEGLQSIALSGSSVTLTSLQAAYPILVLTGTLTSNCNLILPNIANDWIVSNQTTGSYTVQVKTSAGTGVNVAQGSSQYLWGDGTNIYYANASSVTSFNGRTGAITLNASDVTSALGYTPYNSSNPAGYVTSSGSVAYATNAGSATYATTAGNGGVTSVNGSTGAVTLNFRPASASWHNVAGSRALNTVYTNPYSYEIVANVTTYGGSSTSSNFYVSGIEIGAVSTAANTNFNGTVTMTIPPGATYEVTSSSQSIVLWAELY